MNIYFKLFFRGLKKKKLATVINLVGFSIALTLIMFIAVFLKNEFQADNFHNNINSTYRVESEFRAKIYPLTAAPMADWLKDGFPEINESARMFSPFYKGLIYATLEDQSFEINKPVFVDPSFFQIFSFPLKSGHITKDFESKNTVVLTEQLAKKIFGDENPVGKVIKYCGKNDLTVLAVLEKLPANSSMEFELLLPFASFNDYNSFDLTNWDRLTYQTFFTTDKDPNILISEVNRKIKEDLPEKETKYMFLPLKDIHFSMNSEYDIIFRHESKSSVYLFMIVAIAILFIAIINFLNLTVATASLRIKENMVRKIEGAGRMQLSLQYILEAILICMSASILAAIFVELLFPVFSNLLSTPLNHIQIRQPWFYISMGSISLLTGILSGIYPAIKFSRIAEHTSLNNKSSVKLGSDRWNNMLLIFQFAASITLIIATLFIVKQINFIQNQQLGYDKEQIVYFRMDDNLIQKKDAILEKLQTMPGVVNASTSDFVPGQPYSQRVITLNINGEEKTAQIYHTKVSENYIKTLDLELIEGRDFYKTSQADQNNFIVNETFVKEYDLKNPLSTPMDGGEIIGVVKDFNFNSLHQPIGPLSIRLTNGDQTSLILRTDVSGMKNISSLMSNIQEVISNIVPESYIEIKFLNDQIQQQYMKEAKIQKLLGYLSFFAIFISSMGLLGLVILVINQRIKEIGIRKVNGAKISEVMIMLNIDFLKWIAIAFIIASPIAFCSVNKWLENFAYKTTLSWWIFALAGLSALAIALLTVSWQSWRAARKNPVEALRYE